MLIVALDVFTFSEARKIVESTKNEVTVYKVGMQLLTSEGPHVIQYLNTLGKAVFLDLKLHEIPSSVASAVKAAGMHGVKMITVHASGGKKMMEAAVSAASKFPELNVLALTVVSGLSNEDLTDIGFKHGSEEQVLRLAKMAEECGCHGVIASSQEAALLRSSLNRKMLIVTPGIRPKGCANNDQGRIGTPAYAAMNGASHIIVGRPIVEADNPEVVVRAIKLEFSEALNALKARVVD